MKSEFTIRLVAVFAFSLFVSCNSTVPVTITSEETALINDTSEIMRVMTVDNDSAFLRNGSTRFNVSDLNSPEYARLERKMINILKLTDGEVGLSAPQIGIHRRMVAIVRTDKEGNPIEVYPNIRIEDMQGEMVPSKESCLSIPNLSGVVMRYNNITIVYTDVNSDRMDQPREIREEVTGEVAFAFQHEVDMLDGIFFTDKLK